jgi:hypothetical protein
MSPGRRVRPSASITTAPRGATISLRRPTFIMCPPSMSIPALSSGSAPEPSSRRAPRMATVFSPSKLALLTLARVMALSFPLSCLWDFSGFSGLLVIPSPVSLSLGRKIRHAVGTRFPPGHRSLLSIYPTLRSTSRLNTRTMFTTPSNASWMRTTVRWRMGCGNSSR